MTSLLAQIDGSAVTPNWHPANFVEALWSAAAFGILGVFLLMLGFKLFDWLTPKLDFEKELADKNVALAVVLGSLFLGLAFIVAHSISG